MYHETHQSTESMNQVNIIHVLLDFKLINNNYENEKKMKKEFQDDNESR